MIALAMAVCCAGALFEVQPVTLDQPDAQCFLAQAGPGGCADLCVLSGQTLTVYPDAEAGAVYTVALLPGTSAVDIADTDGDGMGEAVTVCGERIVRYDLGPNADGNPEELFALATQLAEAPGGPFPHVLVVHRGETTLLALPCETTFELRTLTGQVVERHDIGAGAPRPVTYGRPFSAWVMDPPQVGPPGALELRVSRVLAFEPALPDDLLSLEIQGPMYRRGTPRQARDAAELDPEAWPWFPLRTDGTTRERVLYALSGKRQPDTVVRIRRTVAAGARDAETQVGPKRSYPGILLDPEAEHPDFNKDGYVDLVLWKAPMPAVTVQGLSRAVTAGRWPLRITVHLFRETAKRYAPQPSGYIATDAPVSWFLAGAGGKRAASPRGVGRLRRGPPHRPRVQHRAARVFRVALHRHRIRRATRFPSGLRRIPSLGGLPRRPGWPRAHEHRTARRILRVRAQSRFPTAPAPEE